MCISATEWNPPRTLHSSTPKQQVKLSKVRVQRLTRKTGRCEDIDMELKNLKLYMENISILEENEKLRKRAILLHQENLALMTQFQKKFLLPSKQ